MSPRAPSVCITAGCTKAAPPGQSRCEEHRLATNRQADQRRPNSAARGYGDRWRRVRAAFIRDNPTCIDCGAASTDADHAPLSRRALLAAGVTDPDQPQFLEPRCRACHSRKTAATDGSFGRTPKARHE
jgi:5-methylcytosine-specific restriction protein A